MGVHCVRQRRCHPNWTGCRAQQRPASHTNQSARRADRTIKGIVNSALQLTPDIKLERYGWRVSESSCLRTRRAPGEASSPSMPTLGRQPRNGVAARLRRCTFPPWCHTTSTNNTYAFVVCANRHGGAIVADHRDGDGDRRFDEQNNHIFGGFSPTISPALRTML